MEDLLKKVQEAFKAAFDVDPRSINIDTKPGDVPPWDSLGHVALVSSLEQVFGLSFDVDEVMEMENVRQIVKIVQAKLSAPRG
ncbi:MAG TPA: acyl carrier protein [Verrucomicrobiae bacterium]|nr:acyl carrier protein [Verrucomicrobiae bacterium]